MISRTSLLAGIEELKQSPWYNFGKMDPNKTEHEYMEEMMHYGYLQRKEAVEIIEDICIKKEPAKNDNTVHARWEINCDGYYPYCSNCKNEPQGREMTLFCPNCGAIMDGDSE